MGYRADKEREELERLYPEGSREREVLEYSRATSKHQPVPPMLVAAFKVLMGITILMGIVSLVALLSH